ncbi:MAG TPA: glycosyltransferase, partial [Urbifossiella sp.]|nr:glycosyltransferase [Urbifossiella sp.]
MGRGPCRAAGRLVPGRGGPEPGLRRPSGRGGGRHRPAGRIRPDWPLHWHYYRRLAPALDRLWTDAHGAARLAAAGIGNVRAIVPFGRPAGPPGPDPAAPRDIDLLWVGNLNPAVHRDRLPWAARVAGFGDRYRVRIVPGLDPRRVRPLLGRARVAFLPSFHGGWDGLVGEALAAGAVVVRDAPVPEVAGGLVPGEEFLPFADADLDDVLGRVLADEPRRRAITAAGQARAADFSTAVLWDRAAAALEAEWDAVAASAAGRAARGHTPTPWDIRHWQALCTRPADAAPGPAGDTAGERLAAAVLAGGAADRFRDLMADPDAAIPAALHLAEALDKSGEGRLAAPALRRAIETLNGPEELSPLARGVGPLRPGFDAFRVEWERAGWANAGDPAAEDRAKRALLRARCELLLGQATDDPARVV